MIEMSGYGYKCSAGETFDMIALIIYGHEKYAANLINANPKYAHIMTFTGVEILLLPVVEVPEAESEEEYVPSTAPWKE